MAGQNVEEEFVAIAGIFATGDPDTATPPTTATAELVGFVDHGITTAAGVTRSTIRTSTDRMGWQNNAKLRTLVSKAAVRFKTVLLQSSLDNVELYHGVPMVNGRIVADPGREWPLISIDYDQIDGVGPTGRTHREYARYARVVEVGDQVGVGTDSVGWDVTIETEWDPDIEDENGDVVGGHSVLFFSEFETVDVPTITTALPGSKTTGDIVNLIGTHLGSVTAVTVGGVSVAGGDIDHVSDTELHITLPAGSAGSAPIIATNPGGPSAAKAYTRT